MILCDVGNTSYHFLDGDDSYKKDVKNFNPKSVKEKVYFISVNAAIKEVLKELGNWVDLSAFVGKDAYYPTMGVDRIFAVEAVSNGVVLDAGSAITVDVVRDGEFMGGFIYPGVRAMNESYSNIFPRFGLFIQL